MAETIEKSLLDLDFASLPGRTFTPSLAAWEDQVLYSRRLVGVRNRPPLCDLSTRRSYRRSRDNPNEWTQVAFSKRDPLSIKRSPESGIALANSGADRAGVRPISRSLWIATRPHIPPEQLKKYVRDVKTALPGLAYVPLDRQAGWPARLQVGLRSDDSASFAVKRNQGALAMNKQLERPTVTEEELTRIEEQIQSRLMGRVHDFQLVVRDHGLVLRGHVRTYYAKQIALKVARETTCVPIQANEIEVI